MLAITLVPTVFFGLAMTGVISQGAAMNSTKAVLLGLLFVVALGAARLSGASVAQSIVSDVRPPSSHLSEVAFGVPEVPVHLQTKPELR